METGRELREKKSTNKAEGQAQQQTLPSEIRRRILQTAWRPRVARARGTPATAAHVRVSELVQNSLNGTERDGRSHHPFADVEQEKRQDETHERCNGCQRSSHPNQNLSVMVRTRPTERENRINKKENKMSSELLSKYCASRRLHYGFLHHATPPPPLTKTEHDKTTYLTLDKVHHNRRRIGFHAPRSTRFSRQLHHTLDQHHPIKSEGGL
jgi:hypothetical protein